MKIDFGIKSKFWLTISLFLYVISTFGLAQGVSVGFNLGERWISPGQVMEAAFVLGLLSWVAAITIQAVETAMILSWDDGNHDDLDKWLAGGLIFLDFLALCLALGVHEIIIWWSGTENAAPGDYVLACFSILFKCAIAFLGSFYAERALAKAISWRPGTAALSNTFPVRRTQAQYNPPSVPQNLPTQSSADSIQEPTYHAIGFEQEGRRPGESRAEYHDRLRRSR